MSGTYCDKNDTWLSEEEREESLLQEERGVCVDSSAEGSMQHLECV